MKKMYLVCCAAQQPDSTVASKTSRALFMSVPDGVDLDECLMEQTKEVFPPDDGWTEHMFSADEVTAADLIFWLEEMQ